MIVLTGAAGFIGSCILAELNRQGFKDIVVVDHLRGADDPKAKNLDGKQYSRYLDKQEFLQVIQAGQLEGDVTQVIHMGACSSTTVQDADYFESNNFQYSIHVCNFALKKNARFIYASSAATYGDGGQGYSDDHAALRRFQPLNLYGWSKQKFDLWVEEHALLDRVVGLKFFNVFGPNEYHKADMRSVVAKAYDRVAREGKMVLFKSYKPEYADGEQKRDFIYVKDAVAMVMFFVRNPKANGIFNVGTGAARTWNDLAHALFAAVEKTPNIEYVEMPEVLRDKYQYFTQAEMAKLRASGYTAPITPLEDAVRDYVTYLKSGARL